MKRLITIDEFKPAYFEGIMSNVNEFIFDTVIGFDTPVYYDTKYYIHTYKYLKPASIPNDFHVDTLESDILRACNDAYIGAYENDLYKQIESHIEDLPYFSHYEDKKGNKVKLYDADYVAFIVTKKQVLNDDLFLEYDYLNELKKETMDVLIDWLECEYLIIRYEYSDSHPYPNDADIKIAFTDYNEITHEWEKHKKNHFKQLKDMIKNHVSLNYHHNIVDFNAV